MGKVKIIQALKRHNIPEYCIKKALTEIDPDEYISIIKKLIRSKSKLLMREDPFAKKKKIIAYLLQKGFEYESIMDSLEQTPLIQGQATGITITAIRSGTHVFPETVINGRLQGLQV